ncbi:MAG: DUF4384 domain-containing protein [Pelagimonas sp.]|nr:DUF4384 domain-containing protein [Pelagimonas sp.]
MPEIRHVFFGGPRRAVVKVIWRAGIVLAVWMGVMPVGHKAHAQETPNSLGALLDRDAYLAVPSAPPLARGDYLGAPARVSLRGFTPPVGNQGAQSSCVGWATAYAARTLIAAKQEEATSRSDVGQMSFSPAYVFNQIKADPNNCMVGSRISDALSLMSGTGAMRLADFPYTDQSCSRLPSSADQALAAPNTIKTFNKLWGQSGRNRHIPTRRALADGHPVVIGMWVTPSFNRLRTGEYVPSSSELGAAQQTNQTGKLVTPVAGGHAMTVVGYDDTRNGGSFEVINSWGRDWGDEGFFWIRYDDFNTLVSQGYEMIPKDPPPPPKVVDLSATLRFVHLDGHELGAQTLGNRYRLDQNLPSGSRFRVEATPGFASYLTVIGGDSSGRYGALFPRGDTVSAHVSQGATLLVPGPSEAYYTRLDDKVGLDFWILLVSQEPLDGADLAARLSDMRSTPMAMLRKVLGDRMSPDAEVTLTGDKIGFSATTGAADVVALVVEINHIAPRPEHRDTAAPVLVLTNPAPEGFDLAEDPNAPTPVHSRFLTLTGQAQDESDIAGLEVLGALSTRFSSRGPFKAEIELPAGDAAHPVRIVATDIEGNTAERVFHFRFQP